jgi:hypothetical protein
MIGLSVVRRSCVFGVVVLRVRKLLFKNASARTWCLTFFSHTQAIGNLPQALIIEHMFFRMLYPKLVRSGPHPHYTLCFVLHAKHTPQKNAPASLARFFRCGVALKANTYTEALSNSSFTRRSFVLCHKTTYRLSSHKTTTHTKTLLCQKTSLFQAHSYRKL